MTALYTFRLALLRKECQKAIKLCPTRCRLPTRRRLNPKSDIRNSPVSRTNRLLHQPRPRPGARPHGHRCPRAHRNLRDPESSHLRSHHREARRFCHLEHLPLGLDYPAIVEHVHSLAPCPELAQSAATLIVGATVTST